MTKEYESTRIRYKKRGSMKQNLQIFNQVQISYPIMWNCENKYETCEHFCEYEKLAYYGKKS